MSSVNKVILVGRLGKDPEVRDINGTNVANFSLATSESWKDKDSGEKKERAEWHKIVAWGNNANVAQNYLNKGSLIYLEGQLQTRKWTDKDDNERYTTEVKVSQIRMLGNKSNSSNSNSSNESPADMVTDGNDDIPF